MARIPPGIAALTAMVVLLGAPALAGDSGQSSSRDVVNVHRARHLEARGGGDLVQPHHRFEYAPKSPYSGDRAFENSPYSYRESLYDFHRYPTYERRGYWYGVPTYMEGADDDATEPKQAEGFDADALPEPPPPLPRARDESSALGGASRAPGRPSAPDPARLAESRKQYEQAWQYIGRGGADKARGIFRKEIEADPQAALAQIGYAVASAELGDLKTGVASMRLAFLTDPNAVTYVPVDVPTRSRIRQLILRYDEAPASEVDPADAAFMGAALHLILAERNAAYAAVSRAIEAGDPSPSTAHLRSFVAGPVPD